MIAMLTSRGGLVDMVLPASQGHHNSTGAIDRQNTATTIRRTADSHAASLPAIHETRIRGTLARRSRTRISASATPHGPVSGQFASGRGAERFGVVFCTESRIVVLIAAICAGSEVPTEKTQDKKPHIVSLAVGCFDWCFPDFLHIAPSCREVRASFLLSDFSAKRTSQAFAP